MQIDSSTSSLNFILVRKGGDKLYETHHSGKLPFITLNPTSNENRFYNKMGINRPFISGIDDLTSYPNNHKSRNLDYKGNDQQNYGFSFDKDKTNINLNGNNITSISFNDISPLLRAEKNIFNDKYTNLKMSCSSSTEYNSDKLKLPTNRNNAVTKENFSVYKKDLKQKKLKFVNEILKDNKKFLVDNFLAMNKGKKKVLTKFSRAKRELWEIPKKTNKYPILKKDICTGNLVEKNNELNNRKLKLIPYIMNEKYNKDKLWSSLDKSAFIKNISLKAEFQRKSLREIKENNSSKLFLFQLINRHLNTFKKMNNFGNNV